MMGLTYVLLCLDVYVSVWMFVWSIACDVMLEMPNKRNLKKVVEQMIRVMPFSGFLVSNG
jgi:nucleoside recognition membrane protein YjiH